MKILKLYLFFILIVIIIFISILFILDQNKENKTKDDFCEINGGKYNLENGVCNFLFGDKDYNYLINLKNKCFSCTTEECLYNNILEVKGVLCYEKENNN